MPPRNRRCVARKRLWAWAAGLIHALPQQAPQGALRSTGESLPGTRGPDGVSHVEVTLRPSTATVQADPSRVTPDQIEARLAGLGFEARAVATA